MNKAKAMCCGVLPNNKEDQNDFIIKKMGRAGRCPIVRSQVPFQTPHFPSHVSPSRCTLHLLLFFLLKPNFLMDLECLKGSPISQPSWWRGNAVTHDAIPAQYLKVISCQYLPLNHWSLSLTLYQNKANFERQMSCFLL